MRLNAERKQPRILPIQSDSWFRTNFLFDQADWERQEVRNRKKREEEFEKWQRENLKDNRKQAK